MSGGMVSIIQIEGESKSNLQPTHVKMDTSKAKTSQPSKNTCVLWSKDQQFMTEGSCYVSRNRGGGKWPIENKLKNSSKNTDASDVIKRCHGH